MRSLVVIAALCLAPALARAADLLVCYPGQAGDTKSAQPTMDAVAKYLAEKSGLKLSAIYFNVADPALAWKKEKKPAFAILSLSCWARWQRAGETMTLLAACERRGKTTQKFHVVVGKDAKAASLADLRGKRIASNHSDDESFVRSVIFDGAPEAKELKLKFTRSALSALRRVAEGQLAEQDAVLIDDDQLAFLDVPDLRSTKEALRVVWSSRELPLAPVVAFAGATDDEKARLKKTLIEMSSNDQGKQVLNAIQATGFKEMDAKLYEEVAKAYAR